MEKVTAGRSGKRFAARKILYWVLVFVCIAGIHFLSAMPAAQSQKLSSDILAKGEQTAAQIVPAANGQTPRKAVLNDEQFRNLSHVAVFFLLSLFLTLALRAQKIRFPYLCAGVFCVLYGGFDELFQGYWVIGRGMQLSDLLRDCCGGVFGIAIIYFSALFLKGYKCRIYKNRGKNT